MRFFFLWFALSAKHLLRSGVFWCCGIFLVLLVTLFAWVTPERQPVSMQVGLLDLSGSEYSAAVIKQLLENEDFRFVQYEAHELSDMQEDLVKGELHCAYLWNTAADTPPITVFETDASYMRAIMDELVLSAWFEVNAVPLVEELMQQHQLEQTIPVAKALETAREEKPLAVYFEYVGMAGAVPVQGIDSHPLFYALLICVFLLFAILLPLLSDAGNSEFSRLIAAGAPRRRAAAWLAPALARALLLGGVLLGADLLASGFMQSTYPLPARLMMAAILAVFAAGISPLISRLRGHALPLLMILPVWMAVSIVCSGALIDPVLLGPAGILRFLSPAWYLLQLMGMIG